MLGVQVRSNIISYTSFNCHTCQKTNIALDKMLCFCFFSTKVLIFFLFLHENIRCRYSLEVPRRGASNEYPQNMFLWRNKKNIYLILNLV